MKRTPFKFAAFRRIATILLLGVVLLGNSPCAWAGADRYPYESIWQFAMYGDLAKVKAMLAENPAQLNQAVSDKVKDTPLDAAANGGAKDVFDFLLERGATLNPEHTKWNAVAGGNVDILRFVLAKGVALEAKTPDGEIPLVVAARDSGNMEMLKFLVESGADVKTPSSEGLEAFYYLGLSGENSLLKAKNRLASLQYLLSKGADINARSQNGETCLARCLEQRIYSPEIAALILQSVQYLLQSGADPNLFRANYVPIVNLANGIGAIYRGETQQTQTIRAEGNLQLLQMLLRFKANPDVQDTRGETPLNNLYQNLGTSTPNVSDAQNQLSDEYSKRGITLLMKAGANPDIANKRGVSPRSLSRTGRRNSEYQKSSPLLDLFRIPDQSPLKEIPNLLLASSTGDAGDSQNKTPAPRTGEIALLGTVSVFNKTLNQLTVSATRFSLPSGKTGAIHPAKIKTIVLTVQTFIHFQGKTDNLTAQNLATIGSNIEVIGTDVGSGKSLRAREVIILPKP